MAEEQQPAAEAEVKEEGMSRAEIEQRLAAFEAKIEANDFDGRPFHNVVKEEVYPLLGEEALSTEVFQRLVRKWASRNYPYDWQRRSYVDEAD